MGRVMGIGHLRPPRNFANENKFSSEGFLANCHWQFSPTTIVGSNTQIKPNLKTTR